MAFVAWNENLSVGIAQIDQQHRQLIDMINELHDAMCKGQGKNILKPLLARLFQYTQTHFTAEEALMQQAQYPKFAAHKAAHEKLVSQVRDLKQRFDAGEYLLSIDTMKFLQNWLTDHILGVDKQYVPCLTACQTA